MSHGLYGEGELLLLFGKECGYFILFYVVDLGLETR